MKKKVLVSDLNSVIFLKLKMWKVFIFNEKSLNKMAYTFSQLYLVEFNFYIIILWNYLVRSMTLSLLLLTQHFGCCVLQPSLSLLIWVTDLEFWIESFIQSTVTYCYRSMSRYISFLFNIDQLFLTLFPLSVTQSYY